MLAFDTPKRGLRLPILFGDVAARGAGAARVTRIDQEQRAAVPSEFVAELASELAPALIEHAPIEPCFLRNVATGLLDGSSCRCGHVRDSQVFQHDDCVVLTDRRAGVVQSIVADIRDLALQTRHFGFGFAPIRRELHFAAYPALIEGKALFVLLESVCTINERAIGERGKTRYAEVDSDRRRRCVKRLRNFALGLDRDGPLFSIASDGDVLGLAFDLTALAKANPADLGQIDTLPVDLEALRETDALRTMLLLEARETCSEFRVERPNIGLVEVAERLLQWLRMNLTQKRILVLEIHEIVAHRLITQPLLAAFVAKRILGQQFVPYETGAADELPQERGVGLSRKRYPWRRIMPGSYDSRVPYAWQCSLGA